MVAAAVVAEKPLNPVRPSAVSRFLAWADRLPGHGWWLYPGFAIALFAWAHAVLWLSGIVPFGSIVPVVVIGVPYGPFALGALAYINHVAARSLASFWPATGWPDADRAVWTDRLVTTPAGTGWACLLIGAALAIGSYIQAPMAFASTSASNPLPVFVALLPMLLFGYSMLPAGAVHIWRKLALVTRIHREATAVDPFDRAPLYAFSRLTAQAGLTFIVVATYSLTVNGAFQAGNVVSLVSVAASLVVGAASFVVPLWGIHDRLVREKEVLFADVERRLSSLGAEMYRRVDAGQFDGTKVVSEALAGVVVLRDRIARLPTWPWAPNLFRGFISALLLPIIVYLLSRFVGGQVGV